MRHKRRLLSGLVLAGIVAVVGATIAVHNDWTVYDNGLKLGERVDEFTEPIPLPTPGITEPCSEHAKEAVYTNRNDYTVAVRMSYQDFWKSADNSRSLSNTFMKNGVESPVGTVRLQNQNDWELHNDGWYYYKNNVAPGATTSSLLKSVYIDCDVNLGMDNTCVQTATGQICQSDDTLSRSGSHYHVVVVFQACNVESPTECGNPDPKRYANISVDPNGGTFRGREDTWTDVVEKGTTVDISAIARTDYTFRDWTKNGNSSYSGNTIVVNEDTSLVANWVSDTATQYTVTVDPNGGSYNGSTTTSTFTRRAGEYFQAGEATSQSMLFSHWTDASDGSTITDPFVVQGDITIQAQWDPIVARIERTGKLYSSIMNAHAEAQDGDTITLLVNTTETVTISKRVTLDLDTHTVTGSITNNVPYVEGQAGFRLINGEVNNPNGAAATNNGHMIIGYDDYDTDVARTPLIDDNYVRLIGTTIGIDQKGYFEWYDGYAEGVTAVTGGAKKTPMYHNTFDDRDVWYKPFVTSFNQGTENYYQHAELESIDNAVSKTIDEVTGEIYYYNLDDNIQASAIDHQTIYAIRDFPATYTLNVPANATINFDISGYNVTFANETTIGSGATFNITNSKNTGMLLVQKPITNNSTLNFSNITAQNTTTTSMIINKGAVNLANSNLLTSNNAFIVDCAGNVQTSITMDSNSTISAPTSTSFAVRNGSSGLTITGGSINSKYGITNNVNSVAYGKTTLTLNNTNITVNQQAVSGGVTSGTGDVGTTVILNNTNITVNPNGSYSWFYGIYGVNNVTMNGNSRINIPSTYYAYLGGIYAANNVTLNDTASITLSGNVYDAYGVMCVADPNRNYPSSGTLTMKDSSSIRISGTSSATNTTRFTGAFFNTVIMSDNSTINVATTGSSTKGTEGIYAYNGELFGGSITATCGSSATVATAIDGATNNMAIGGTTNISGGIIGVRGDPTVVGGTIHGGTTGISGNAIVSGGTITGGTTGIVGAPTVTGGTVTGDQYGISTTTNQTTIIGEKDEDLFTDSPVITGGAYGITGSGNYKFYDGTIRGSVGSINSYIVEIPDHTNIYTGTTSDYEVSYLTTDDDYLRVGNTDYNSLIDAYDAVADGGTIYVIADRVTSATLPTNPSGKEITIDLNGHTITYSQTLINNGTINIVDGVGGGKLANNNPSGKTIQNNGTLNINSGEVSSINQTVYVPSSTAATTVINGGKISSSKTGIYSDSSSASTTINDGSVEVVSDGSANAMGIRGGGVTINNSGAINMAKTTGTGSNSLYAIYSTGCQDNINLNDNSTITVTDTATTTGSSYGIYSSCLANVTMRGHSSVAVSNSSNYAGGIITAKVDAREYSSITVSSESSQATGVIASTNVTTTPAIITDDNFALTVTSTSGIANGITMSSSRSGTLTKGTINVTGATAYGLKGPGSYTISNANITATATTATAGYGLYASSSTAALITGGNITASGYGIYNSTTNNANLQVNITGGSVTGGTDGIYKSKVTIGADDGDIRIRVPQIEGTSRYGIEGGIVDFYDGVLRGGTNAYETGIINSIPDGATYHIETIADLENCWLTKAQDYLEVNGDTYNSLDDAYAAAASGDTIKVIASVSVEAVLPTNPSGKTIYFDLNGHELTYTQSLTNAGTMIIINSDALHEGSLVNQTNVTITNSGTLTISGGSIYGKSTTISNSGSVTISGGHVYAEGTAITSTSTSGTSTTVSGGTVNCTSSNSSACIANPTITITGTGAVNTPGAVGANGTTTISGNGAINITGAGTGVTGNTTISDNGAINITGAGKGISGNYTVTMTGGSITTNGGYGIYYTGSCSSNCNSRKDLDMSGGTITSNYGVYIPEIGIEKKIYVTGGTIDAAVTGIYIRPISYRYGIGGTVTIGEDDGTVSTTSPLITGGEYAIYNDTKINFYDGKLRGGIKAYQYHDDVTTVASGYTVSITQQAIDGATYEVRYLTPEHDVARINNTRYTSLSSALAASSAGDTIVLLDDIFIYDNFEIPNTIDVTIETDGFNIYTGYTIDNKGKVAFINSNNNTDTQFSIHKLEQWVSSRIYCFHNYAGATLTLDNISIEAIAAIDNDGTAILDNSDIVSRDLALDGYKGTTGLSIASNGTITIRNGSSINSDNRAILTYGTTTIANSAISATTDNYDAKPYSIYLNGGTTTTTSGTVLGNVLINSGTLDATGTTIQAGYPYTPTPYNNTIENHGTLKLTGATVNYSYNTSSRDLGTKTAISISTNATAIIDSSTITGTLTSSNTAYNYSDATKIAGVYNGGGTLTVRNNSDITSTFNEGTKHDDHRCQGIVNTSTGTLSYVGSSVTTNASDSDSIGIANDGTATITSGTIAANTGRGTAVGYSNATGTTTIINLNITSKSGFSSQGESIGYQNTSGTTEISNITILATEKDHNTYYNSYSYGLRSTGGSTVIHDGLIETGGGGSQNYGMYITSGSVTLGDAEPEDSADRGWDTADVNTSRPSIRAIGKNTNNTIGVNNGSNGTFNFYDGRVTTNGTVFARDPNETEWYYEVRYHVDGDGYNYGVLEWIRPLGLAGTRPNQNGS